MKTRYENSDQKKLLLKKSAIAHLTLTPQQMAQVFGGGDKTTTGPTESNRIGDDGDCQTLTRTTLTQATNDTL